MNVKKLDIKKAVVLAPLALLLVSAPHAQKSGMKVGIVNVQKVLAAAPGGASFASIRKQADADLGAQAKKIQALQQKIASGGATAADRQTLDTSVRTYNAAQEKYNKQLSTNFTPVKKTVDAALASAAKAQGFALVLDYAVAQQSCLVIYADSKATDLTAAVIKQLKK